MKLNTLTELLGLGLVLAVGAVGCKSTDYGVTKLPNKAIGGTKTGLADGAAVKDGEGGEAGEGECHRFLLI